MLVVGHVVLALVAQVAGDAATPAIAPSEAKSIAVCDLYHILASFGQPAPQVDVDHDGVIGTADLLASLATLAGDSSRPHPPSSHFERESAEDVAASPFHRPPDRGVCHSVAWAFSAWFAAVSFAAGFAAGSVCCPVFCALMNVTGTPGLHHITTVPMGVPLLHCNGSYMYYISVVLTDASLTRLRHGALRSSRLR